MKLRSRGLRAKGAALLAGTSLVAIALSGCSGGASAGGSGGGLTLSKKPVTLTFQWWGDAVRAKITRDAVSKFEKLHHNIHIQTQFADYSPYQEKLATESAGGNAPDIFQMDLPYLSTYGKRGALLDLNTLKPKLDLSSFQTGELQDGEVGGKLYALVNAVNAPAIMVNPDLLKKAGVAMPDDTTWTWSDLVKDAAAVSKASGGKFHGMEEWGYDEDALYYWERAHGSQVFDTSGHVKADAASVTAFFQYVSDLQSSGATAGPSVVTEDESAGEDASMMATGKAAFAFEYTNALSALRTDSKAPLQLLRLPTTPGSSAVPYYYNASQFWSVSSRTSHPAEAALFLDFLANSKAAADSLAADRGIPANPPIRTYIAPKLEAADKDQVAFLNGLKVASAPAVPPPGATTIHALLQKYTESVMFKRTTPSAAADGFIKDLTTAVNNG